MSTTKVINHLSVDNLNLNEVLSQQDKFFVNDDLRLSRKKVGKFS